MSSKFTVLAIGGAMAIGGVIRAAVVTPAGIDGANAATWRSTGVAKSSDLDNNNVYGSAGYVAFATSVPVTGTYDYQDTNGNPSLDIVNFSDTNVKTLKSIPSYLSLSQSPNYYAIAGGFYYPSIDDPTLPTAAAVDDVQLGLGIHGGSGLFSVVNLTFGANTPSTVRVGLITMGSDNGDGTTQTSITQTAGVGANLPASSVTTSTLATSLTTGERGLQIVFYDLTGVQAGDTFSVNDGRGSGNTPLVGLTFDAAVPEPTSLGLAAAGGLVMLRRRVK